MDKSRCSRNAVTYGITDEINWTEFHPRLHVIVRRFVYKYRIPGWYGQEEEIAEDVTQETVKRFIERQQKSVQGIAEPIDLPEQMMVTIAHNYILDLTRREYRMIHLPIEDILPKLINSVNNCLQIEEIATENVNNEWLFSQLAREISYFPTKQRRAILTDLANRTCFEEQQTPLQAAFLAVGINLQDYALQLSDDPVERTRHIALVSLAYKRISLLFHAQQLKQVA